MKDLKDWPGPNRSVWTPLRKPYRILGARPTRGRMAVARSVTHDAIARGGDVVAFNQDGTRRISSPRKKKDRQT